MSDGIDTHELAYAIISASNTGDETLALDGKRLVIRPASGTIDIDLSVLAEKLARIHLRQEPA